MGRAPERRPTDPEARAAVRRVVEELFDVPAVLQGRKPLAALAGAHWVLGSVALNAVSVAVNSRWADNGRKVASTMYMRDTRAFVATMLGQMGLTAIYQIVNSASWWMRTKIGIVWRQVLTEKLHRVYFEDTIYYRQTTWPDGVPDPAQRIASDVSTLVGTAGNYEGLTSLLQSYISTTLGATNAVWRLYFLMPDQRWLVPFVFAWSYGNLTFRNWFAPAMMRATLMAKGSRISGAYRDAQGRLSQHAEAIISFGGVPAEQRRLLSKLEESLENSRQLTMVYLRENLAMNLVGEVFSATMTHALVHFPMLSPSYAHKAAPGASEELRMEANANILGEIVLKGSLIRSAQQYVGHLSRLGRSMLQSSGSAIRIAALLDLADRAPQIAKATRREEVGELPTGIISMDGVDVLSPTGVQLVAGLTLTVTKGDSLLLYGASGVGKTAICRTLKGLWPGEGGVATCPRDVMFLPQTPYCPVGSLQAQLTYPDRAPPIPMEKLRQLLHDCSLDHLLEQKPSVSASGAPGEEPFPASELSLGEQQRLAIARVLLKAPQFVVLDEAPSAVDPRTETKLFEKLSERGITTISVSARPSLLRFHSRILKVKSGRESSSSDKGWSIASIDQDKLDFPSPIRESSSVPRTAAGADIIDADSLVLGDNSSVDEGNDPADRGGESPATPSSSKERQSKRPMPRLGDIGRTLMLVRLVLPRLSLADSTILRMLGSTAMMGINIWIQTTFISSIPGVLQSFVLQSDGAGYLRFTLRALVVRLCSMVIGVVQQWLQSGITITWRDRLTRAITTRFLANDNFYAMAHTDRRIVDADQRITVEVMQFVQSLAMLVSSPWRGVLRTAFDACFVFVLMLRVRLPLSGAVAMVAYGTLGMGMIKLFAPDFTHFNVEQERYSAQFRAAHNRVQNAAESIAFSDGGKAAELELNAAHGRVLDVANRSNNRSSLWTPVQMLLTQSAPMYIRQILPFMWSFGEGSNSDVLSNRGGAHMQEISQYIETLVSRAFQTMSAIMGMHQQFAWLFGSARRISDVLLVLDELDAQAEAEEERRAAVEEVATPRRGQRICLSDACITAPDGETLVQNLSFSVEAGSTSNLLIAGAHGVGKSAVVRALSGLWPLTAGRVGWPTCTGSSSRVVVIPQAPLVPTLSLLSILDHCTYPLQLEPGSTAATEAIATLAPLMQRLRVHYLVERNENGWHVIKPWE
jgi:putative ATP-binding cassette transporter